MRDALAALKRRASCGNVTSLFFCNRFIIQGSIDEAAGKRINHHFQQTDDGIQLAGIEPIYQFVRVLFLLGG